MLADFCAHWRQNGIKAIDKVFKDSPAEYIKIAVQLLPRQVAIDATSQNVHYVISDKPLSPEEWAAKYADAGDEAVRARSIQSSVKVM